MSQQGFENVQRLVQWSRGEEQADAAPVGSHPIESIGILGAGTMGIEIAAAHLRHHMPVVLADIDAEVIARAQIAVAAELAKSEEGTRDADLNIHATTDIAQAARCDLVIEAIVEKLAAKQTLYVALREQVGNCTIVASNTSTIPLERLAPSVPDAARFCGLHFLHPVRRRPLVEIVRGRQTSDQTIAAVVAHVRRIGRMPIVVNDGPGFLVNRLLFPYLGEALELLREGTPAEAIEAAAREFGLEMGPLRLIDEIGLDTTLQAGWVLASAFPDRIAASPLLVSLVKAGRLGEKTGAGFFAHAQEAGHSCLAHQEAGHSCLANQEAGHSCLAKATDRNVCPPTLQTDKNVCPPTLQTDRNVCPPTLQTDRNVCPPDALDPAAAKIIAPWLNETPKASHSSVAERLILPMLLEATRILDEGTIDVQTIDLATVFGLGFPAEKGGLLHWADSVGVDRIVAMLQSATIMGTPRQPTPWLERAARFCE